MKKIGFAVRACAIILALAIGMTGCPGRGETIRFATGGLAGTYFPFGTAIAAVLGEELRMNIIVSSTGASMANIQQMQAGIVEMALVQNDVMDYAWRGVYLFEGGQYQGFRTMAAMYPEVCQVVALPGINSISELRGMRVAVGDEGSGTEFNARQILAAHDITFDDIIVHHMGFAASAIALQHGVLDAAFVTSGAPTPAITSLALTQDITILGVEPAAAARLMEAYPFYTLYTIPAGTYAGVNNDVLTVAVKATLIVSERLSEDTVYRMTRALFEHRDAIALGHARGHDIDLEYAVQGVTVPFHPGAARFFRAMGVMQ
ncbi:MAG: TAXI family TRAP transporter solute-binding subunit [Treponema sp.]|jgi:TRAP transporter TAXI family solute receptor|nr:TAXI family TRAP transporter solute-binding subunit [Treponema sp.]